MQFEDESIRIHFEVEEASKAGHYRGIRFHLYNQTDSEILLHWNKVFITNAEGHSGPVMHTGMRLSDCASLQAPSIIPIDGSMSEIAVPCDSFKVTGLTAVYSMLPSPNERPVVIFGLRLPLQIGDEVKNYEFQFQASKE